MDDSGRPTFLCDAMLGSLARWLRLWGYDAVYLGTEPADEELAERARREGRWLLTRDRELAAAGPRTVMIRSEPVDEQVAEVFERLGLRPGPDLAEARCAECNGAVADASREDVAGDVPPYVLATAERFRRCLECGRVYWPGTHVERILERMRGVLARLPER